MTVGVLALQGFFNEHIAALRRLGVQGVEIRKADQLLTVFSLIIPGGESTTMAKLAEYQNLIQSFEADISVPQLTSKGGPDTYRGVFIRAPAVLDVGPDIEVLADYPVPSNKVLYSSPTVQIQEEDALPKTKVIVAVKQKNLLATAFYPELTADLRWHSYFIKMMKEIEQGASSSSCSNVASVGETILGPEQAKPDLPIFQ